MSSLFNKFRNFPQYFDVLDTMEKLNSNSNAIAAGYDKAYGTDFGTFRKTQPNPLKGPLESIHNAGLLAVEAQKGLNLMHAQLPIKMPELKALQEHLLADFNDKVAKRDAAKKAADTLVKEEAKLQQLQSKGKTAEISKQESVIVKAKETKEKAEQEADRADAAYSEADAENRKKFPITWIDQFMACIEAQKKANEQFAKIGQDMVDAAQKITPFVDPAVPKLRERLELWEQKKI